MAGLSFKNLLRRGFGFVQKYMDRSLGAKDVYLLCDSASSERIQDFKRRLEFYCPAHQLIICSRLPLRVALSFRPVLSFGLSGILRHLKYYRGGIFDIDPDKNPHAPSMLCKLSSYCAHTKINIVEVLDRFTACVVSLRQQGLERAYVFGTGPSLALAAERDWSDGYRIVCNTIVRDPDLWKHINPHFIVAADALYHFSYTKYARTFREDLAQRLAETSTFFVYPAHFHQIVVREFGEYHDRLIPIPNDVRSKIYLNLTQEFSLPRLGNVLPWLLLPLACTLSKKCFPVGIRWTRPARSIVLGKFGEAQLSGTPSRASGCFSCFFQLLCPQR